MLDYSVAIVNELSKIVRALNDLVTHLLRLRPVNSVRKLNLAFELEQILARIV